MHVCEDFRERITEQIIERRDIEKNVELQREFLVCNSCADFYAESRDMMEAISNVSFDVGDEQWDAMADRLRVRILTEHAALQQSSWLERWGFARRSMRAYIPAIAGAAAMVLIAVGVSRMAEPLIESSQQIPVAYVSPTVVMDSPNATLDPVTVEFLEQSELLLRNVMNLRPGSTDDVQEAQQKAGMQLLALNQRKEAAAVVPPVVNLMDKYELILRDVRNIKSSSAAEDISDIKNRIQRIGLIASMTALQPKASEIEADLDHER